MKNKKILFFLCALIAASFVINSCKKETQQDLLHSLFTTGTWQLSAVIKHSYVGSTGPINDTLNTTCDTTQFFTFANNTCTYTNFHCITQSKTGSWTLINNGLYLQSNIAMKDTVSADSCCVVVQPFANTQIVNLGNYSMTLNTGDIGAYYTATQKRTIYTYTFVRIN
jgi:hypothetical protein